MSDVLEIRRAVDALCVELACERICDEELDALKKACDNFEEAVKTKDVKVMSQYNNGEITREEAEALLSEKYGPAGDK